MNCGPAVIVSETSSMPEVCGPAGYFIDPGNPESIATQMQKVVEDFQLRQNKIALGLKFKEQFSWDKTAEICWNALKNAHQMVNQ
jgi:glycosyltransferase involved in cell wall biosynthesis